MHESENRSSDKGKGIPLTAATVGALTGFGAGYLMAYITDVWAAPPMFGWSLAIMLLPYATLVTVTLIMWLRKPLTTGGRKMFIICYWTAFVLLYVTTMALYWMTRI